MKARALLFLTMVLAAACQTAPSASAPGASAPGSGGPTASPGASGGLASGSLSPAVVGVAGPGDFILADPAIGLAGLPSYRATLTIAFDGTAAGQARTWSMTTTLAAASPASGTLAFDTAGDPGAQLVAGRVAWMAVSEGALYQLDAGGGCSVSLLDQPGSLMLEQPASSLTRLLGAEAAGREAVDGIEVDSFTFDQRSLGFKSSAQATGRVSLATQGGYVTRYDLATTGGPDYFGEGVTGTLTTAYTLADVGAAVTADIPADCPAGRITATLPTDATDRLEEPGLLSYRLAGTVDQAVAIVRGNAVIDHWTAVDTSHIDDDNAHLVYTSGGLTLDVWVRSADGATLVEILGSRT